MKLVRCTSQERRPTGVHSMKVCHVTAEYRFSAERHEHLFSVVCYNGENLHDCYERTKMHQVCNWSGRNLHTYSIHVGEVIFESTYGFSISRCAMCTFLKSLHPCCVRCKHECNRAVHRWLQQCRRTRGDGIQTGDSRLRPAELGQIHYNCSMSMIRHVHTCCDKRDGVRNTSAFRKHLNLNRNKQE